MGHYVEPEILLQEFQVANFYHKRRNFGRQWIGQHQMDDDSRPVVRQCSTNAAVP